MTGQLLIFNSIDEFIKYFDDKPIHFVTRLFHDEEVFTIEAAASYLGSNYPILKCNIEKINNPQNQIELYKLFPVVSGFIPNISEELENFIRLSTL